MAELKTKLNEANVDPFLQAVADEEQREESFRFKKTMAELIGASYSHMNRLYNKPGE